MTRPSGALSIVLILLFLALAVIAFAAPAGADSLWTGGAGSLFTDQKARAVGDVLTVSIVQQSVIQHKAANQVTKDTSATAAQGSGLLKFFPDLTLSAKRDASGAGTNTSTTSLVDKITAKVVAVMPNGLLQIEGSRHIQLAADKMELHLSGLVRPRDIGPDNTVPSSQVAEAVITWTGSGPMAETKRPGLITRILGFLW
jgi:flagellar L-ring protein precursor FlgH